MDPIATGAATTVSTPASGGGDASFAPLKDSASKFDQVKAQLRQTADSLGIPLPQSMAGPSTVQPGARVQGISGAPLSSGAVAARTKVERSFAVSRYHMERIQTQIAASPTANAMQKTITGKLASIENQYNQLDEAMRQIDPDASPQQWLRLQQLANTMNENINVLAKLVDSASSGVKTILQTQI